MNEERQTNYTIGEGFELPSKGLIYDKPVNAQIELRSMTARDEMKRLSPSRTPLKTLADIIEGCCIEKPAIHVYDMCLGDYEFLLHQLRIITYGSEYKIALTCPYCGNQIDSSMQLSELTLKPFNIEEFNNLKTFTLPKSGSTVELVFQTPRSLDNQDIKIKEMQRKNQDNGLDPDTYVKLLYSVKSIDGQALAPFTFDSLLNTLPAKDLQKILNNIDKLNSLIGIDTTFYTNCPSCGQEVKSFFRFGTEFFRPSNI